MPPPDDAPKPRPFDVRMIETLIRLMAANDLSEIDLHEGDARVRLRRGPLGPVVTAAPAPVAAAPAAAPAAAAPAAAPAAAAPAADGKKYHVIKSPTPGTFYAKPSPDEPPFVKVGSKVTPASVVCKIEAMKIFNDIAAECTGTVVEVLVENAQPVEYNTPLFKVEV